MWAIETKKSRRGDIKVKIATDDGTVSFVAKDEESLVRLLSRQEGLNAAVYTVAKSIAEGKISIEE